MPNKQVTGGAERWPVYDRFGTPICVGNKLLVQHCVGSHGQDI